jgi:hypothetical protein
VYGIVYSVVNGIVCSVVYSAMVEDDCELRFGKVVEGIIRSLLPE